MREECKSPLNWSKLSENLNSNLLCCLLEICEVKFEVFTRVKYRVIARNKGYFK